MKRKLPTFKSLQAFEAAARTGSIAGAANELNVTEPAIGQQVRNLETQLARTLFLRDSTGLTMTPEGAAFYQRINASFDDIAEAVETVSPDAGRSTLTLFVTTFISTYLIPQILGALHKDHPDIDLIFCNSRNSRFRSKRNIDLGILCGDVPDGWTSEPWMTFHAVPVCAPELLNSGPGIAKPADLLNYPLVFEANYDLWSNWFKRAGVDNFTLKGQSITVFDNYSSVVQMVKHGHGIGLLLLPSFTDDFKSNRLTAPLGTEFSIPVHYHIAAPAKQVADTNLAAVKTWLQNAAETFVKPVD